MDAEPDKVIVTNRSALAAKYGGRVGEIWQAVDQLIATDEERGLSTVVVGLDDAGDMDEMGPPVANAGDPAENKAAVDAVFSALTPSYLVLLGSIDVIPHQDLDNPMFSPPEDTDEHAWGDLPYACDAPYSRDIRDFIGPSRVVGRLPDVTGASDPEHLLRALETARTWKARPRSDFDSHFGLSADEWTVSTQMSLTNVFGSASELKLSPTEGPVWEAPILERLVHFINCHGAPGSSEYLGSRPEFPVSHQAAYVTDKLPGGTIASVECCYGAELYDPSGLGEPGMCNTYLTGGAYGFFGSSTISYGPADDNAEADLICQYFVRNVLAGASLGRATLEARQEYVRVTPVMEPAALKTLAQFSLMGDPAIAPVAPPQPASGTKTVRQAGPPDPEKERVRRGERRENLTANGLALVENTSVVGSEVDGPPEARATELQDLATMAGIEVSTTRSFGIRRPRASTAKGPQTRSSPITEQIHVMIGRPEGESARDDLPHVKVVVAAQRNDTVVVTKELYSR